MIREGSGALQDVIHQATPDLGSWVVLHSLSQADKAAVPDTKGILALVAVEEHPTCATGRSWTASPAWSAPRSRSSCTTSPRSSATTTRPRAGSAGSCRRSTPRRSCADPTCGRRWRTWSRASRSGSWAPTHDERNQIWGALGRAGRLSVFYEVDVAPIPVLEREGAGRISEHRIDHVGTL